jgi:hypothetical protein
MTDRFDGWIAGLSAASGMRVVVGHWRRSPLGAFSDVIAERPDGHSGWLALSCEVVELVTATDTSDEVRRTPVTAKVAGARWRVTAGPLAAALRVGRRTALGALLRAVPRALATHPRWIGAIDVVGRIVPPGVRTRGSAVGAGGSTTGALDHTSPPLPSHGPAPTRGRSPRWHRASGSGSSPCPGRRR